MLELNTSVAHVQPATAWHAGGAIAYSHTAWTARCGGHVPAVRAAGQSFLVVKYQSTVFRPSALRLAMASGVLGAGTMTSQPGVQPSGVATLLASLVCMACSRRTNSSIERPLLIGYPLRLLPGATWWAVRDLAAAALGRDPVRVPILSRTGVRCLAGPDCYDGDRRLIPPGVVWQETFPARILLTILTYRPIHVVRRIQAPVLIVAAEQDSLIPFAATRKAAARIAGCQLEALPIGHFDLYDGPWFEKGTALQIAFLRRHLGLAGWAVTGGLQHH